MANNEVTYEIVEHIAVLKKEGNGFQRELNIVSWNGGPRRYDLRSWQVPEYERMTRGITLCEEEAVELMKALSKRFANA